MDDLDLNVQGLAELEASLQNIQGPGAKRALTKGLRQGNNVVLREARNRVRKKTGATAKATQGRNRGQQGQDITFSVTTNEVGRFLELGTSKMPPHPFLRPASEAKAQEVVEVARDVTLEAIEAEARRR